MTSAKQFRKQIAARFDMEELRLLAFALQVDWDELDGYRKSTKIQSLIEWMKRRQRLPELIATLHEERADEKWPDVSTLAAALTDEGGHSVGRNRQNILRNIHFTWIEGVLQQDLHHEVALTLGLTYKYDVLNHPSRTLYPEEQPIPPQTRIGEVFGARGRSLLILGEPASGKTITLLQLALELLAVAQSDPTEPIPVVLNLSSWVKERRTLSEWIVEELLIQYQTPRQVCRSWLMANRLSLLLDGLDEVAVEQREVCVTAINAFKADHPGDIVVCSRLSDYEKLGERLNLSAAIRIQPLDPTQIDDYLASFGPALTNLRQAVAADDEWRELAQSPLMLNLMAFTYREANALPTGMTLVEKRRQLLTAYIQRTWQRRPLPPNNSYNKPNALFWLHNLAAGLQANNQSIFYIEQLQPSWLPNPLPYRWLVGIIFGLVFGLIFGLLFGVDIGLLFGLGVGLNGVREKPVRLIEEIQWQRFSLSLIWEKGKEAVVFGILLGVLFGQLFVPLVEPSIRLLIGLSVGLSVGMFVGLRSFTQIGETRQRTQPNQGIWTSWRNARWIGFIYGGLYGLSLGLLFGLSLGFINGLISGLISRLSVEMISGLRDELISGLISGLSVGLVNGLISGLSVGLVNGMRQYGGETVVRHYVLRWLLARQRVLPFPFQDRELIAYLDAMAERLLLRRVGGGWMFIHRTLLDYFAENRELGKGDVMGDE